MGKTSIEWTDFSVNPIRARNLETGAVGHFCERISPGCKNCYACTWNSRVRPSGTHLIGTGLKFLPVNRSKVEIFFDDSKVEEVLRRKKPTRYFVCDMTDLFGEWVPDEFIDKVFAMAAMAPQHTFQILTKRAQRMQAYFEQPRPRILADNPLTETTLWHVWSATVPMESEYRAAPWMWDRPDGPTRITGPWPLPNVWLGVSTENQRYANERIPHLLQTPAAVRFISAEPLLGWIDLTEIRYRDEDVDCQWNALTGRHEVLNSTSVDCVTDAALDGNPHLDLVIAGGESGGGARECFVPWIEQLRMHCYAAGVAYFLKQVGAKPTVKAARVQHYDWHYPKFTAAGDPNDGIWRVHLKNKKGGDPSEWPAGLRIRQLPGARA